MKNNFAADTMALVLRLERRKLSSVVKSLFKQAEDSEISLWIPAMVLAEEGYLSEKRRIETTLADVKEYVAKYKQIKIAPVTEQVIEQTFLIDDIPELHDRIIAATAIAKKATLITNDPIITASQHLDVIW